MAATIDDIAAASRDVVTANFTSDIVKQRYPSSRDNSASPATGYFDALSDAQATIDARGSLICVERRRFTAVTQSLEWPAVSITVPCVTLTDAEHAVDSSFLVARLELDLEAETTTYELFG